MDDGEPEDPPRDRLAEVGQLGETRECVGPRDGGVPPMLPGGAEDGQPGGGLRDQHADRR